MATDIDFSKHANVLNMITEAQDSNSDMRQGVRDAKLFLNKRDGQWDPYAINKMNGRFRGTFDMCTPIVDQISGEIDQSDFSLKVAPISGESSMDTAKVYNGLIRNIKNISNFEQVSNSASRSNVIGGFDAVEVIQDYVDGNTMDQDLIIQHVPNAVDSVWFDLGSVKQDASDSRWGVKLISIPAAEYKESYPKGSDQSIGDDKQSEAFFNKADAVVIGKIYYKKKRSVELVEMTNGSVYEVNDDFKKVKDELEQAGVTVQLKNDGEEKRRTRKSWRVHSRLFDGGKWLEDEVETVFDSIPLVPIYGNFEVFENKLIYFGKIEKLYDQQRILNYAMSRDIEDGALSPRRKYWATGEQIEGYEATIQTMNTNNDPLQQYNHVDGTPPPFMQGGIEASNGLQTTIANTQQMISASSNSFNALQGNANPNQSGIAGSQQIEQGNTGSIKWFESKKIMECQIGKILIPAIPRAYDSRRQVRIIEEDDTSSMVMLNDNIYDAESGQNVELNNLSKGLYGVTCEFGPAFNSQQKETTQAFLDMAAIDPSFLQQGKDIMLKNLAVPGMDQMAERARDELLNAGMIPESQWTDEERQKIEQQQAEAQNQPPQEDPNMIFARAEELNAQTKQQQSQFEAQNKQAEMQGNQQIKMAELQISNRELDLKEQELQLDAAKFQRSGDAKFNTEMIAAEQSQQKINNDFALKLEALEQQYNKNLNNEIRENMKLAEQANNITQ